MSDIPDAAVEAAIQSVFPKSATVDDFKRRVWEPMVRRILEAAAPHMLAAAREAADDIRDWKEYGPEEAWSVLEANHARLSRYRPTP